MRPAPIDPPEIHDSLWQHTPKGQVAWDIGANCGQTLPILNSLFDHVYAFEPAEECASFLSPWQQREGVTVLPWAISDHTGHVTLAALPDKIDTGQLVTPGTHGMEWTPDIPEAVARTVPCYTVDALVFDPITYLRTPQFLKVDVEGHEAHVLAGARRTIAEYRPQWLIEFHTPELHDSILDDLKGSGYAVQTVRHPHYPANSSMFYQHGWLKAFPK